MNNMYAFLNAHEKQELITEINYINKEITTNDNLILSEMIQDNFLDAIHENNNKLNQSIDNMKVLIEQTNKIINRNI